MFKTLMALLIASAFLAIAPAPAPAQPAKSYVVLDQNLSRLRADFNANVGKVRMLYVVGPTCGVCLRGMSDLQESLYSKRPDDPRMVTFVVYVPTLGAHEANVVPASHLITDRHTTHYWEESGIIGRRMEQVLGTGRYTWDVWMIYGPKAVWKDALLPPPPDFWQHQLDGLTGGKKLDPDVFAANVNKFLAQVPNGARVAADDRK